LIDAEATPFGIKIASDGAAEEPPAVERFRAKMMELYARVPAGWRLLIDMRSANLLQPESFEASAALIAAAPTRPARIAIVVSSAVAAMQMNRLYRTADRGDAVQVFDSSSDPAAFARAEAVLK